MEEKILQKEKYKIVIANLNYLINMIIFISNSLDMNIDRKLFKAKIIKDIFFVANTIIKIENYLKSETIEENYLISIIKKLKWTHENIILLLDNIIKGNYKHAIIFSTSIKDFKKISATCKLNSERIQHELKKRLSSCLSRDTQVSKEELQHLFFHEENTE